MPAPAKFIMVSPRRCNEVRPSGSVATLATPSIAGNELENEKHEGENSPLIEGLFVPGNSSSSSNSDIGARPHSTTVRSVGDQGSESPEDGSPEDGSPGDDSSADEPGQTPDQTPDQTSGGVEEGTVVSKSDKGFGFIRPSAPSERGSTNGPKNGSDDLFFFQSALENIHFDELQLYAAVEYCRDRNDRGPCAVGIHVL